MELRTPTNAAGERIGPAREVVAAPAPVCEHCGAELVSDGYDLVCPLVLMLDYPGL